MSDFDTTPEPRFLRGLQNQNWTVHGALAELIDNSFGPGRGNARNVEIIHHPKERLLAVLDGGVGMRAVGELFKLGATAGRTPNDIGEYGQGGTMALLWLFQEVHVWTVRDGKASHVRMKWDEVFKMTRFPIVPDNWEPLRASEVPDMLANLGHGTLIIGKLLRERKLHISNVRRDLSAKFAPAIRYGKEIKWKSPTDEQYLSNPLPAFAPGKAISIDLVLQTPDGHDLGVRGEIGVVPDLPLSRSKVHVGFGPRVIKETRDFFEPLEGEERYRVAGIAGWLDLLDGWQPYLATTKDEINDTPVYERLRQHVFERIQGLLEELRRERENLLLDDVALDLNLALDGGQLTDLPANVQDTEPGPPRQPRETNGSTATPRREPEETKPKPAPRVSRLELTRMDDIGLQGRLCYAERQNGDVAVFVNEDHPVVRTALEREPINRLALALLVLGEVARVLNEDHDFRKRVFPTGQFRVLEAADESVRLGLIHRVLVDRVHEGAGLA